MKINITTVIDESKKIYNYTLQFGFVFLVYYYYRQLKIKPHYVIE